MSKSGKTIYLCGGINGLTDAECTDWREKVKRELDGLYYFLDPMRRDYRGKEDESADAIVREDLADINVSSIVLVNAERPSWGTAMETFYAFRNFKSVYIVCPHERISPWLRHHSYRICKSLSEAIELLRRLA